jgi:hypothetical protein
MPRFVRDAQHSEEEESHEEEESQRKARAVVIYEEELMKAERIGYELTEKAREDSSAVANVHVNTMDFEQW